MSKELGSKSNTGSESSAPVPEPEESLAKDKVNYFRKRAGTVMQTPLKIRSKPPEVRFAEHEELFEASLKNMPLWIDSMFVYSLIWAFGSILTLDAKKEFDIHMRKIFHDKKKRDRELEA